MTNTQPETHGTPVSAGEMINHLRKADPEAPVFILGSDGMHRAAGEVLIADYLVDSGQGVILQ